MSNAKKGPDQGLRSEEINTDISHEDLDRADYQGR